MPGFFGTISPENTVSPDIPVRPGLVHERKQWQGNVLERHTPDRFMKDKPFFENEDYLILAEGVVLNRRHLQDKYNLEGFDETMVRMYHEFGEAFFNQFRGSFSGVFIDKKKDLCLVYTNHIGDKQVFYANARIISFLVQSPAGYSTIAKSINYP